MVRVSSMVSVWLLVLSVVAVSLSDASPHDRDDYHKAARTHSVRAFGKDAELDAEYWINDAQAALEGRARMAGGVGSANSMARNVVMFLGDGMSVPTLTAARTLLGQRRGDTGEEARLFFEQFPTVGLAKTYCVDAQTADSACSASAYLCGVKANIGTIGVTGRVTFEDCDAGLNSQHHLDSLATWALEHGRDAGLVTTTRVTHASPAGVYSHTSSRDWESDADVAADCDEPLQRDIAHQLVHALPGNRLKVVLGGGRREFLPNTMFDEEGTRGRRQDGRNLIEEWQADKLSRNVSYEYVWNRDQLQNLMESPPEYLLGLFEGSHMQYHMEADATTEPTLAELTEIAIKSLSRNPEGFFLFVEGGRIDHAHHDNLAHLALDETIELSAAVARAAELLDEEDSLIVVTSDHAHVMSISGYTRRGGDILGPSDDVGADGVPYTTIAYSNGPGYRPPQADGERTDPTTDDYDAVEYVFPAAVPLDSETHGGDDVAVFARGPHHALFSGLYEQSHIPHRMAYAACIGPGLHACSAQP